MVLWKVLFRVLDKNAKVYVSLAGSEVGASEAGASEAGAASGLSVAGSLPQAEKAAKMPKQRIRASIFFIFTLLFMLFMRLLIWTRMRF